MQSDRILAILVGGFLITGCSPLSKQEALSQFASATTQTETTFSTSLKITRDLGVASDAEANAVRYLDGGDFSLTPQQQAALDPGAIALPRALLRSISRYAESLALAADEGNITALEDAAGKLFAAVGTAVGGAIPGGAATATPAASLVGRLFSRAFAQQYIGEIEHIIWKTNPAMEEAARLLKEDLSKFSDQMRIECVRFPEERVTTLIAIAEDWRLTRLEKWKLFRTSLAEVNERRAGCDSLRNLPALLGSGPIKGIPGSASI